MIITKEQQEVWVNNYVKEKHTQDECIGFIDGVEKAMSIINSAKVQLPIFVSRCLTYGIKIYPYQQNTIIEASEKYKVPNKELELFNADKMIKYVNALDWATCKDSKDWSIGLNMLKEIGFKEEIVKKEGHRSFVTMIWQGVPQHSI